jgi:hypothetical protein
MVCMNPQPDTGEVLAGLVERVTYHNAENGFCVLRARARGALVIVGPSPTADDALRLDKPPSQLAPDRFKGF